MLSGLIAWRFRKGKTQNRFISFISGSSIVGIALGCFVLITILSVMNGFEQQMKDKILNLVPQGELTSVSSRGVENWQGLISDYRAMPGIRFVQPFSTATGMLQKGPSLKAVNVSGIQVTPELPEVYENIIQLDAWERLRNNANGILLGARILSALNLQVGDKIQLLLPSLSDTNELHTPTSLWLDVMGEVKIGGELDALVGFMHMSTASDAMKITHGAGGIQFYFTDPFVAPQMTRNLGYDLAQPVYISDWTRTQGHLYNDIQLVRVVVYIVLILVIAVACFNIVSGLVMSVNEKQTEIAVLKTMGASNGLIMRVFILQGAMNGLIGTAVGVGLGVVTALNISQLAGALERWLGFELLSGDIYFIDFLPSVLNTHQVVFTAVIALSLSLLSTCYPAFKAARLKPAQLLGR